LRYFAPTAAADLPGSAVNPADFGDAVISMAQIAAGRMYMEAR
jgi:hypothetical protein